MKLVDDLKKLAEQLAALRDARARGVRRVRDTSSSGAVTEIEYRSDNELVAAIDDLERRLGVRRPLIHQVRMINSKGIYT